MKRRGFISTIAALIAAPFAPKVAAVAADDVMVIGPWCSPADVYGFTHSDAPPATLFKGELGRWENVRIITTRKERA